jgi:hypothetical protein
MPVARQARKAVTALSLLSESGRNCWAASAAGDWVHYAAHTAACRITLDCQGARV